MKEKQKFCMWLMKSKADIDDELLNMSDAFFSEMKNAEEKKFKQFCEWRESDNFAAELEHCLSKRCHEYRLTKFLLYLEIPLFFVKLG